MALTLPTTFTGGTTAESAEVNDNFRTIYNAVGSQEFDSQNYITNNASSTLNFQALDAQLKIISDSVEGGTNSQTYIEQDSVSEPESNQVIVEAMEGINNSETILTLARENAAGSLTLLTGDASHKQWVYRNDATPLWVIDSSVTDRVLGLKGGSGSYNVNGGVEAGNWSHTHSGGAVSGTTGAGDSAANNADNDTPQTYYSSAGHTHSFSGTVTVGNNSTFRPYAAVGTLQYPDTES